MMHNRTQVSFLIPVNVGEVWFFFWGALGISSGWSVADKKRGDSHQRKPPLRVLSDV